MNPYYKSLYDSLDLFSTEGTGTQLINILVEYLCEDPRWLVDNISTIDAERLVKLSKLVEEKFRK